MHSEILVSLLLTRINMVMADLMRVDTYIYFHIYTEKE